MKNLFPLLSVVILLFSRCSATGIHTPQITLNDSSCIKIIAENIVDTINIQTLFCSKFPFRPCNGKKVDIVKPGVYYITYRMSKPDFIKFHIGESFQSFLIPGDTMVINVGFKANGNKEPPVYYKITGNIHDYFQAKKKKFGYYSFTDIEDNPVSKFFNKMEISKQSFIEAKSVLTISTEHNISFLNGNKQNLPDWFVELEKANIIYGSAYLELELFKRLKPADQNDPPTDNVEFNNPEAHLSSIYYYFLFQYLDYKYPIIDINLPFISWKINQFTKGSHFVDSLLGGEIKDYFITCRLADLYFFSNSAEDLKTADTFITDNYPLLTEDKIRFINYDKDQVTKFLGIKSSLSEGDKAPRFYLKDINGTSYELSSFKGKLVFLHFWATWCEPSVKKIPKINLLYSKLGSKPVEIVNICLDNNPDKWKQIIENEKLKGTNLICRGTWEKSLKSSYFIDEVPHYTLVDQNGKVIDNKTSGPDDIYLKLLLLTKKR
jgi:thiol-disulfide isomerase/thioredoxin